MPGRLGDDGSGSGYERGPMIAPSNEKINRPVILSITLLFFSLFTAQCLLLIDKTSPTADEVAFHTVNGFTYLKTADYRMSPANPPMIREWMALPWLIFRPTLDLSKTSWQEADSVPFAKDFFYKDNRYIADKLLYSSRFMITLLGVALGFIIFIWSRRMYGVWGGVLSLVVYSFCPHFVAHSSLATTDIGVTLFSVAAGYCLWEFLTRSSRVFWIGMLTCLSLAFAAKYNSIVLGPIFLFIILIKKGPRIFFQTLFTLALFSFFIVWATYLFEFKPLLGGGVPRVEEKIGYIRGILNALSIHGDQPVDSVLRMAKSWPVPMPSYFLGLAGIVRSHRSPYLHYAFGEWTTATVWYYYFFVFFVKMTVASLVLIGARAATAFKMKEAPIRTGDLIILLPTALIFLSTCFDSTSVGIRYLFVPMALLYVWVGGLGQWLSSKLVKIGVAVLLLAHLAATALSFPNYLSYFNFLIGGSSQGYRYVRGSDVDWGQGLKSLKKYLNQKGIERVGLIYFGLASDPTFYGIDFDPVSGEEKIRPQNKVYAISVFTLEYAEWTKKYKPTVVIDNCMNVYDFRNGVPS
jgi:hypothetical protein